MKITVSPLTLGAQPISILASVRPLVNFNALETKLTITRRSRARSARTTGSAWMVQTIVRSVVSALKSSSASPTNSSRSTSFLGISDCPSREKASRSSIKSPIRFADWEIVVRCRRLFSESDGPALFCNRSTKPKIWRSGARKSWETE